MNGIKVLTLDNLRFRAYGYGGSTPDRYLCLKHLILEVFKSAASSTDIKIEDRVYVYTGLADDEYIICDLCEEEKNIQAEYSKYEHSQEHSHD